MACPRVVMLAQSSASWTQKTCNASRRSSSETLPVQTHCALSGVSPQPSARRPELSATATRARAHTTCAFVSVPYLSCRSGDDHERDAQRHRQKIKAGADRAYVRGFAHRAIIKEKHQTTNLKLPISNPGVSRRPRMLVVGCSMWDVGVRPRATVF